MDLDEDSRISRKEWTGETETFNRFDRNSDGLLTVSEIEPFGSGGQNRDLSFRGMDLDGDGRISSEEWQGPSPMFDRMDADSDGYLARQEIRQRARGGQSRP